jgi:hypothetical protein
MAYFEHCFDSVIALHPVGRYHYTVVYLPAEIAARLPFESSPRLRIEADVSGVAVKGAWQPSGGRWYLMLPRAPLKQAGLGVGAPVEVSFRLLPQDAVELPPELAAMLASDAAARAGWAALSAGKQRGLAYQVASAKRPDTRAARLRQVRGILLGELPEPWKRRPRAGAAGGPPSGP